MKALSLFLSLCVSGSLAAAPKSGGAAETESASPKSIEWTARMAELSGLLPAVFNDVLDRNSKITPERLSRLETNTARLRELAHRMRSPADLNSPDADPSVALIADLFEEEIKAAELALKGGHFFYAQNKLKSVAGYCVACHTRVESSDSPLRVRIPVDKKRLSDFEQAELFSATRQFDEAFKIYFGIVKNPKRAAEHELDWDRAVRRALAISIRVKEDPKLADSVASQVTRTASAPRYLRDRARKWREDIARWKEERKDSHTDPLVTARTWVNEGGLEDSDRQAVALLRASALVHQWMRERSGDVRMPEALLLAGEIYERLQDVDLWSLHELFYESCIRRAPHTEIGQECFDRYEESVYMNFSGSGGISLPEDVRKKIDKLRGLAQPAKTSKKAKER